MRVAVIALALLLAACAPAVFEPIPDAAPGVTLTATADGYRVVVTEPVRSLFLRFPGASLSTTASECVTDPVSVACIVRNVEDSWQVAIAGDVLLPPGAFAGIACRDECWHVYLSE